MLRVGKASGKHLIDRTMVFRYWLESKQQSRFNVASDLACTATPVSDVRCNIVHAIYWHTHYITLPRTCLCSIIFVSYAAWTRRKTHPARLWPQRLGSLQKNKFFFLIRWSNIFREVNSVIITSTDILGAIETHLRSYVEHPNQKKKRPALIRVLRDCHQS